MSDDLDNQLPFIQVARDASMRATSLAPVLGVTVQHARGALVILWEGLADRRLIAKAIPEGAFLFEEKELRLRLLLAFGKEVEPALLEPAGFLARESDGRWRVRGMSRYIESEQLRLAKKAGVKPTPKRAKPAQPELPGVPPAPPVERKETGQEVLYDAFTRAREEHMRRSDVAFVEDAPKNLAFINSTLKPFLEACEEAGLDIIDTWEACLSRFFAEPFFATFEQPWPFHALVKERTNKGAPAGWRRYWAELERERAA